MWQINISTNKQTQSYKCKHSQKLNYSFLSTSSEKTRTTSSSSVVFMYQHKDDVGEDDGRQPASSTLRRWFMERRQLKRMRCEMPRVIELCSAKSWKPSPISLTVNEIEPTRREYVYVIFIYVYVYIQYYIYIYMPIYNIILYIYIYIYIYL